MYLECTMHDNDFSSILELLGYAISEFCKFYGAETLRNAEKRVIIDYCKSFLIHTQKLLGDGGDDFAKYLDDSFWLKIVDERELDYDNREDLCVNIDEGSAQFGDVCCM